MGSELGLSWPYLLRDQGPTRDMFLIKTVWLQGPELSLRQCTITFRDESSGHAGGTREEEKSRGEPEELKKEWPLLIKINDQCCTVTNHLPAIRALSSTLSLDHIAIIKY